MSDEAEPQDRSRRTEDYSRMLGIVEALSLVTKQCPSAPVRKTAEQALADLKNENSAGLQNQVYFVLTAMKGWRGDRASQIHRSLTSFLEEPSSR